MTGFLGGNIKFITFLYPRLAAEIKYYDIIKKKKHTRSPMSVSTQLLVLLLGLYVKNMSFFNEDNMNKFVISTENYISFMLVILSIIFIFLISKYIKSTRLKRITTALSEEIKFDYEMTFKLTSKDKNKTKILAILLYSFIVVFYILAIITFFVFDNYFVWVVMTLILCFIFLPSGNIAMSSMEVSVKKNNQK